ncbi:hypothetical protein FISHEDRAFT_55111 [Fistulina hepatica ATCC 64428]|uniref:Uncharacterized protein n=1 Tax=Fistulina hepatica ATCC 64428 TaxID=1128425 RepID=A0A0D7ANT2_9AGAR|nr:hypothetical protein FISHEDRAFT_55111 [Fistulina hepatica ATCC 64428]
MTPTLREGNRICLVMKKKERSDMRVVVQPEWTAAAIASHPLSRLGSQISAGSTLGSYTSLCWLQYSVVAILPLRHSRCPLYKGCKESGGAAICMVRRKALINEQISVLTMRVIRASDSIFQRAGRWEAQTTRSILASWAGASLSFVWHGKRSLRLRTGPATERKDRFNGGTPNLCFNARPMRKGDPFMRTYDVDGAQEIELSNPINELAIVEIMLIDWASTLELESLLINEVVLLLISGL